MRIYFIYIVSLCLFVGCKERKGSSVNENEPLYSPPLSVPLDISEGYSINPFTGDSIRPLLNSLGATIVTGTPYSIQGLKQGELKKPAIIKAKILSRTIVETNVSPVRNRPAIIPADIEQSPSVEKPLDINVTATPIQVTGQKIALHEPAPVRIQSMRFKDNARLDIQYLDIGQGLSFSYITALYEDKNGNLWFGTDGYGICKYDGVYLTTYTQKEGLISNKITSITEDKKGDLWIGTEDGISVFNGQSFLQFTEKPFNSTSRIYLDKEGNIWVVGREKGTIKYDGKTFMLYSAKEELRDDFIAGLFEDSKGIFWFGTSMGLLKYNGTMFTLFNRQVEALKNVYSIVEDSKGNMWFGSTTHGVTKYDGKFFTHYTEDNGLSNNSIMAMIIDKNDRIWIGTRYGGVTKFDGANFTTYRIQEGLSDDKISCIIKDRQENIWTGTSGGGINKINDQGFSEQIKPESVDNSRVRPIIQDGLGHLWFGTEGAGIYNYDGTSITKYLDNNLFALKGFRSALVDRKNNLWFGETDGSGFYKFDYKQFLYYLPPKISANFSLFEDSKGIIWIGTSAEGTAAFNGTDLIYYNEKNGFSSNRVFTTLEDKKNNLWFGTENGGVVKFDGKMFTVFSEKQGLFCKSVTSIIEDRQGNLWFGTLGAGLCKFNGSSFTYYTERQGLALNDIWSVKEDPTGQIWAGTDRGLSLLIPASGTKQPAERNYSVYSFGLEDGLKATDFNLNGVCIDNTNRIWWGTGKALITRDLSVPFGACTPRSVDISYIEINGRFFDFRSSTDNTKDKINFGSVAAFHNYPGHLSLAYDQNHISFHFSAIDWRAPHKIKYSYRLTGSDHEWSQPSAEPAADYRNLGHGSYEFQVKAIGQSQIWTTPFIYRFTIRPAWWQTWWFKTGVLLLGAFVLLFIARLVYLYRLRKQRVLLEKRLAVQYERQRISAEMHDDIGAGLSGIRLLTEITKNKIRDEESLREIEKIYRSVGDVSSKMKEVIWSLNTENDNLPNLVSYIQKQARASLEHYPCQLTIDVPDNIPNRMISGEARRSIFLIVKEALHNIIKHSGADKVVIRMSIGEHLRILISDNGKGLSKEPENGQGNGMKNMRQRIRQLNGNLFIKNEQGLTLIFEIPIQSTL